MQSWRGRKCRYGSVQQRRGGIAIDSAGNIYAAETGTPRRVQKFSPEGEFLLSIGGGVNQGGGTPENPGNVCTAEHIANGDTCGAGVTGTGSGEFSGATGALRTVITVTPDDKVWVGDKDRIQQFNTQGVYQGEIVPEEGGVPQTTQQLTADSNGFLYASYELFTNDAKPDVQKLDPATGEELLTFKAANPRAIAISPSGDVYLFDKDALGNDIARIRHFNEIAGEVEVSFGEDLTASSTGLAVSGACGIDGVDIFHSNAGPGFVRAYGSARSLALPTAQVPPVVKDPHVVSVGTDAALVRARINPEFWDDANYHVEYGTGKCCESGCDLREPLTEVPVGGGVTNVDQVAAANLPGLVPETTYHYRFVAESSGGGPVFGIDPDGNPCGGPQEASFAEGLEGTFTTPPPPPPPNTKCSNQAFRIGASAFLPNCRAFEMVSPIGKNGDSIDALIQPAAPT